MPSTPYAKILTSVDGGAMAAGWIGVVRGGASIALAAESISGWENARWEIFGYPPGWAAPTGWTLEASGLIVSTDFTPAGFTLEAASTRFGRWLPRLAVNNRTKGGVVNHPDMVDESVGWEVLSPSLGLREIAVNEQGQADAYRKWLDAHQKNQRVLDLAIFGTDRSKVTPFVDWLATTDATPTVFPLAQFTLPDLTTCDVVMTFLGKKVGSGDAYRQDVRGLYYRNGGATTLVGALDPGTARSSGTLTTATVTQVLSGNIIQPRVTGVVATNINWSVSVSVQQVQ